MPWGAASPGSLNFGSQAIGTASAAQSVQFVSNGTGTLNISSIAVNGDFSQTNNCPASFSVGSTCVVNVTFAPTASGTRSGYLYFYDSAGNSPQVISLSGAGGGTGTTGGVSGGSSGGGTGSSGVPWGTASPGNLGFGSQAIGTASPAQSVQFVSNGTGPLNISSITANGDFSESNNCPATLGLGSTCTAYVTFTPSTSGTRTGYLYFNDAATNSPQVISLSGTGSGTGTSSGGGGGSGSGGGSGGSGGSTGANDVYGGSTAQHCPNGAAAHFYTQQIGSQWWLCTPAGNVFWDSSVYGVDASDSAPDYQYIEENGSACTPGGPASGGNLCSVIIQKYGDINVTWGPQTVRRLQSWGFTATAEYSSSYVQPTMTTSGWSTPDHSNPQKMPFVGLIWPGHYARNANSYAQPVKDLIGPVSTSVYPYYRSHTPDALDPNFLLWLQKDLADPANVEYSWLHSPHSDYLIGLNVDDIDELEGFGAGPDFPTVANGLPDGSIGRWHPHLGWIILVTPARQSSGYDANGNYISYSDTTVYSKLGLSNWLQARYGNISALNLAWGSAYTTFGSAGGSGLLDENGTHSWVPTDPFRLSGATAAMQSDLDAFLLYYAQQYFSEIKSALRAVAPWVLYLGPTSLGSWGTPPRRQILQGAAPYEDIYVLGSVPSECRPCGDDQQRVDFVSEYGGNKPWMNWEGFFGQPDSYMSVYPTPTVPFPYTANQSQRGALFATMVSDMLNSADSQTGTHHFVGYKWWRLYDDRGQQANWGLLTRRDNPYDGVSAVVAPGMDAWGYTTGGEQANYGNFIGAVTTANQSIYNTLVVH